MRLIVSIALLLILCALYTPPIASSGVEELYWWLRPGVYFTYLYRLPQPRIFIGDRYEYETETLVINYTILNINNARALINLTLTFVNAVVYERCDKPPCPVVEEMVNKTLHTLLEIDLKTLGVYVNNTWIDEWLYLATTSQLRGEAPKLVRVPGIIYEVTYEEGTESEQIVEAFFNMLREELGEDLVKCMTNIYLECEGLPRMPGWISRTSIIGGKERKVIDLRTHGGYLVEAIKPPPSSFLFTIKNYTISGDRVAMIGASPYRSMLSGVRLGLLEVKRNISIGYKRAYAFEVKFAPLKLYALRSIDVPKEEGEVLFTCLFYNPSRREVFLVEGPGCTGPPTGVTGYYDYYTGVLLHLDVSWGELGLMPIQAYTKLLGLEEIMKISIHLRPIPPHMFRAKLVLVDTNISFERPVIGGAEGGFNPVYGAIAAVTASAAIIGVKIVQSRRRSLQTHESKTT
jgi:hypothetical protein